MGPADTPCDDPLDFVMFGALSMHMRASLDAEKTNMVTSSASAPQLPVPRRSALKVEAPSTPATTFDRHNRISHDGRDLDALLSEVEEQSDGTYCQQASRCAIGPSLAWDLYIRKLQKHLLPPLPASHLSGADSSLAQRWPRQPRYITCKRRSDIRLSCNGSQSRSS